MSERRTLAILGLLLGLLAALLVLLTLANLGRNPTINLEWVANRIVDVVLGIGLLLGSVLIYRGRYSTGGIVNLVLGVVVLILSSSVAGILAILSGILGILANEARA